MPMPMNKMAPEDRLSRIVDIRFSKRMNDAIDVVRLEMMHANVADGYPMTMPPFAEAVRLLIDEALAARASAKPAPKAKKK